ncbi:MAG: hypothetical protein M3Q69_02925 [Acidobacteriota bacterium]|nr:hypothetical protein [Acidobacteriota bacterium]
MNGQLADIGIANDGNEASRIRELLEMFQRLPHLGREPHRHVRIPLAVPLNGIAKFAAGALA